MLNTMKLKHYINLFLSEMDWWSTFDFAKLQESTLEPSPTSKPIKQIFYRLSRKRDFNAREYFMLNTMKLKHYINLFLSEMDWWSTFDFAKLQESTLEPSPTSKPIKQIFFFWWEENLMQKCSWIMDSS